MKNDEVENLLQILETRFNDNMHRHSNVTWENILEKLNSNPNKLWSINQMEITGGEPDVVDFNNEYFYIDCAKESPVGRRSLCYDRAALESRKANKLSNCVIDLANEMKIDVLTKELYEKLQAIEEFDLKTSSWIKTPDEIRSLGGALFCDRRYNNVFVYHNGAESYYSARGFRGIVSL